MDILNHAIAGAAVGVAYGDPVTGALLGVLPDTVLGVKRRSRPTQAYSATHSLAFTLLGGAGFYLAFDSALGFWALLSHLVLDLPTHGKLWGPPLLYPFKRKRFSPFEQEWEWFNDIWWLGFAITIFWSFVWVMSTLL